MIRIISKEFYEGGGFAIDKMEKTYFENVAYKTVGFLCIAGFLPILVQHFLRPHLPKEALFLSALTWGLLIIVIVLKFSILKRTKEVQKR